MQGRDLSELGRLLGADPTTLTRDLTAALRGLPGVIELRQGKRVPPGCFLLVEGDVDEWYGNILLSQRRRGSLLGGPESVLGDPSWVQAHASETSWLLPLPPSLLERMVEAHEPLGQAMLEDVIGHAQARAEAIGDAQLRLTHQRFDDRVGQLLPPPYSTGHARVRVVVVKLHDKLAELLPPRVHACHDVAYLVLGRLAHMRPWWAEALDGPEYTEAALLVPASVRADSGEVREGLFALTALPNNLMGLFTGREMFGLPKRYASLYEEAGDRPRAVLRVDRTVATELRFEHLDPESVTQEERVQAIFGLLPFGPAVPPRAMSRSAVEARIRGCGDDDVRYETAPSARDAEQFAWTPVDGAQEHGAAMLKAAANHPELLPRLVSRLDQKLRSVDVLAWSRSFHPGFSGAREGQWAPEQFSTDAIVASQLELRTLEKVQWFRVTNHKGRIDVVLNGRLLRLDLAQTLGVRLRGNFVHRAGEKVLDYRRLPDLRPTERVHLDWKHRPEPARQRELPRAAELPTLAPELVERLARMGEPQELAAREALFRRGAPEGDTLFLVLEGRIEEWRGPTWLGEVGPGGLVGELGVLEDRRRLRISEARARDRTRVVRLRWRSIEAQLSAAERAAISHHALRHGARWSRLGIDDHDMATQQAFSSPLAHFVPGPYQGRATIWALPLARPVDGHLRYRMPPRLHWHPSMPCCMLLVSAFEDFKPRWAEPDEPGISYTETGLFVPTLLEHEGRRELRAYFPWLFPSNIMATFVGRELYGYPKAYANTRVEHDRLVLRLNDDNAFDLRIRELDGLQQARLATMLPDVARAFAPDWARRERWTQRHQRDLKWELGAGRIPPRAREILKGGAKGLLRLPGALLAMKGLLSEVPQVGWRRRYAADLPERVATGQQAWNPQDFDADELVGTRFRWNPRLPALERLPAVLDTVEAFQLEEGQQEIVIDLPGDRPRAFNTLGGIGFRAQMELEMDVEGGDSSVLVDFRDTRLSDEERLRLAAGPQARRRLGD